MIEKVVFKTTLKDQPSDLVFWLSRPVQERFAALEFLREQYISTLPDEQQKFQRVCTVIQHKPD
jgi:hypothetical protein